MRCPTCRTTWAYDGPATSLRCFTCSIREGRPVYSGLPPAVRSDQEPTTDA